MSNGIAVYLRAQDLPDGEWLGRLVASMEPAFAFAEGFDPENDDGWVPCRIGETECGFEWEFGEIESLPAELEGRRFDRVAGLHWRSDANDAICAVLVAGVVGWGGFQHVRLGQLKSDLNQAQIATQNLTRTAESATALVAKVTETKETLNSILKQSNVRFRH